MGYVEWDLSRIKVGNLTEQQIDSVIDQMLNDPDSREKPLPSTIKKRAVKFYLKVLDQEFPISGVPSKKVLDFLQNEKLKEIRLEARHVIETGKDEPTTVRKKRVTKPTVKKIEEIEPKSDKPEQKINAHTMSIKDLFLKLTKSTMPKGHEHLMEQYFPKGWKKDFHGNYYYQIGNPTTMFTSHIDTATLGLPQEVTHVFKGDFIHTDEKTILGADDKAGTTIMIHMIEKGITGLYYFFLNEEHGCEGSQALNTYLETHGDDDLYKNITKVVSLDRRDFTDVITFQSGERCCSDEFGRELAKRLNESGQGFKYQIDNTGGITDSHRICDKFSECTNLSVGYDLQHAVRENQNIVFLAKLAEACCTIDWETLPVSRDKTKTETTYGSYNKRGKYHTSGENWERDNKWWEPGTTTRATAVGPGSIGNAEFVNDYLGNKIRTADAQWCEYDKAWCSKEERIWVDYIGFYTCPDFDPAKVKKEVPKTGGELKPITLEDIKDGLDLYSKSGDLFGKIEAVGDKIITIRTIGNSGMMVPPEKFLTYEFKKKSVIGGNKLMEKDLAVGLPVIHPNFGKGVIKAIRADKIIVKVLFDTKGEKDLRVDVADMKF